MKGLLSRLSRAAVCLAVLGLSGGICLVQAIPCITGLPICRAEPGAGTCSNDASRQCRTTSDCVIPGTCTAAVLGIGGTVTGNPSNVSSVVLTGATNVTLSVGTLGTSAVTFRAVPTNPALDAQATVAATDALGKTCSIPISFRVRGAGAASNEVVCPLSALYSLTVISSPASPAGTTACASQLANCTDVIPSGYDFLADNRILTVRSPIAGAGVQMELLRDQLPFESRLRLLFSRSIDLGATFSPFDDITTSTTVGSTKVRGTATWSDVRVAAAIYVPKTPTLGQWGLSVMTLLLLTASALLLRHRRRQSA